MTQQAIQLAARVLIAVVAGVSLTIIVLIGTVRADEPVLPGAAPIDTDPSPFTTTYAKVLTGGVPVYSHPLEALLQLSPVRTLDKGYFWVSLVNPQSFKYGPHLWYRINQNEYVQADHLQPYQASGFQGVEVTEPGTFAFIVFDTWTAAAPGQEPGDESQVRKRYSIVPIEETQAVDDRFWYRVAEGHWVEQGMVGIVTPKPRPEGVGPDEKWIEIDLYEQTLAAYEGDRIVYATLVSSGLPLWKTITGLFRIQTKIYMNKMSGSDGQPDYYFLEDVPWSMYFHGAYALHGAYWHDRFGMPHSHGCVNLPLADAKWLFEWTGPAGRKGWSRATDEDLGTWVWVHD